MYEQARGQGLVHGGAIKAQGDIYQDDNGILIAIEVDEAHQQEANRYLFHPALIDGSAMAAGALWEQPGQGDDLYLPLHYASFYCTAPLQKQGYVRALASSVKKVNDICTLDMFFIMMRVNRLDSFWELPAKIRTKDRSMLYRSRFDHPFFAKRR